MRAAAKGLAPGWWGLDVRRLAAPLPDLGAQAPDGGPMLLHIGTGWPADDLWFPVVVPLLGAGHLTVDANLRTAKPADLLRAVLLRLLGSLPPALLEVRLVDGATAGTVFAPFAPLVEAGGLAPAVIDAAGLSGVLDEAEEHVRHAQRAAAEGRLADVPYMVVLGEFPEARAEHARIAALAHAGSASRLHFVLAGWPPPSFGTQTPLLDHSVHATVDGRYARLNGIVGEDVRVSLDDDPNPTVVEAVCRALAGDARSSAAFTFADLVPERLWAESSATGVRTVVGRAGRDEVELAFDDATPHWMIGGRSGSGKTVFQLNLLYGLAARYGPDELALYLLDFKEGVSFTEFSPTTRDPSWIPHARAVGIESDREYGIAVLRALVAEMGRRASAMKRAGVTGLADLRAAVPEVPVPRVVTVIDEFHVLLQGDSRLAQVAVGLLEDLARKGRSYGIHLVLASQTISGVDALATKRDSIFGQFPLRVALAGGSGILDAANPAADGLTVGQAVINDAAGIAGRDRLVRFPDAHAASAAVADLRRALWTARPEGNRPPAVFAGYAEAHVADLLPELTPDARHRRVLVGRTVDVGLSPAGFVLDATPGRHLAVLGTTAVGADILHAAVVGLARQHRPGTVEFLLAALAPAADDAVTDALAVLDAAGHRHREIDLAGLGPTLAALARGGENTYLVLFGADAASARLGERDPETRRTGADDLQALLKSGPGRGIHLLGWWRGVKRFAEDVGGSAGREDVACLVALNVPETDLAGLLGDHLLRWQHRPNRALLVDRHDQRTDLIVPFVRPGRYDEDGTW
ncbi:FtsK/SpoIIIE domain-containing protein [Longispora sp. K20-0274]|uniref:FtsK/SpoIIIE domain-containing protein n=1 Tax=Longispora sp. K20-0274 TaxID=3088255 RepID=UPI003999F1F6